MFYAKNGLADWNVILRGDSLGSTTSCVRWGCWSPMERGNSFPNRWCGLSPNYFALLFCYSSITAITAMPLCQSDYFDTLIEILQYFVIALHRPRCGLSFETRLYWNTLCMWYRLQVTVCIGQMMLLQ